MRNVWTIASREFRQYFTSPLAYVVATLILLITGIYFLLTVVYYSNLYYMGYSAPDIGFISSIMTFLFVMALPAVTMRLLADEHKSGTLELLLTSPLHDWELVVGKWFGAFLFVLSIIVITLIYPIVLNKLVTNGIDQGVMFANYLGLILVAAAFLSIGTAISSFFNNQFAALFVTIAVLFFLWWIIGLPAQVMQSGGQIFTYLSMGSHFNDSMIQGKVFVADIVYYLSITALGLFLGTVAVEVRRWQ